MLAGVDPHFAIALLTVLERIVQMNGPGIFINLKLNLPLQTFF